MSNREDSGPRPGSSSNGTVDQDAACGKRPRGGDTDRDTLALDDRPAGPPVEAWRRRQRQRLPHESSADRKAGAAMDAGSGSGGGGDAHVLFLHSSAASISSEVHNHHGAGTSGGNDDTAAAGVTQTTAPASQSAADNTSVNDDEMRKPATVSMAVEMPKSVLGSSGRRKWWTQMVLGPLDVAEALGGSVDDHLQQASAGQFSMNMRAFVMKQLWKLRYSGNHVALEFSPLQMAEAYEGERSIAARVCSCEYGNCLL